MLTSGKPVGAAGGKNYFKKDFTEQKRLAKLLQAKFEEIPQTRKNTESDAKNKNTSQTQKKSGGSNETEEVDLLEMNRSDDSTPMKPRIAWQGKLAAKFGLSGSVTEKQFGLLCDGKHPQTGEQMTKHVKSRTKTTRKGKEYQTLTRRALIDQTISAPKSVSLAAMEDERVVEAHWQASIKAFDAIEEFTRVKMGNTKPTALSGEGLRCLFLHFEARPDAATGFAAWDLHTHGPQFNFAFDADGQPRALEMRELLRCQKLGTAVYRAELTKEMNEIGYQMEINAKTGAPEVVGISRAYIEASSPRQTEIIEKAQELGIKSTKGIAASYRQSKNFDRAEMRRRHAELEEKFGFQATRAAEKARLTTTRLKSEKSEKSFQELTAPALSKTKKAAEAADFVIAQAKFQKTSAEPEKTWTTWQSLLTDTLNHARLEITIDVVKSEFATRFKRGELDEFDLNRRGETQRMRAANTNASQVKISDDSNLDYLNNKDLNSKNSNNKNEERTDAQPKIGRHRAQTADTAGIPEAAGTTISKSVNSGTTGADVEQTERAAVAGQISNAVVPASSDPVTTVRSIERSGGGSAEVDRARPASTNDADVKQQFAPGGENLLHGRGDRRFTGLPAGHPQAGSTVSDHSDVPGTNLSNEQPSDDPVVSRQPKPSADRIGISTKQLGISTKRFESDRAESESENFSSIVGQSKTLGTLNKSIEFGDGKQQAGFDRNEESDVADRADFSDTKRSARQSIIPRPRNADGTETDHPRAASNQSEPTASLRETGKSGIDVPSSIGVSEKAAGTVVAETAESSSAKMGFAEFAAKPAPVGIEEIAVTTKTEETFITTKTGSNKITFEPNFEARRDNQPAHFLNSHSSSRATGNSADTNGELFSGADDRTVPNGQNRSGIENSGQELFQGDEKQKQSPNFGIEGGNVQFSGESFPVRLDTQHSGSNSPGSQTTAADGSALGDKRTENVENDTQTNADGKQLTNFEIAQHLSIADDGTGNPADANGNLHDEFGSDQRMFQQQLPATDYSAGLPRNNNQGNRISQFGKSAELGSLPGDEKITEMGAECERPDAISVVHRANDSDLFVEVQQSDNPGGHLVVDDSLSNDDSINSAISNIDRRDYSIKETNESDKRLLLDSYRRELALSLENIEKTKTINLIKSEDGSYAFEEVIARSEAEQQVIPLDSVNGSRTETSQFAVEEFARINRQSAEQTKQSSTTDGQQLTGQTIFSDPATGQLPPMPESGDLAKITGERETTVNQNNDSFQAAARNFTITNPSAEAEAQEMKFWQADRERREAAIMRENAQRRLLMTDAEKAESDAAAVAEIERDVEIEEQGRTRSVLSL